MGVLDASDEGWMQGMRWVMKESDEGGRLMQVMRGGWWWYKCASAP